jgi:hypothetical protein
MNTKPEIVQAIEDFQAGRLGTIPAERMPHQTSADDALPKPPSPSHNG